jgi:Periplasmic binding protein domain/Branched-chain amino acid transport system / permease component
VSTASIAQRMPTGIRDRMNEVVSQLAAAAGLIVVFVALSFASPYFLTSNNLFNVCVQIAVVAILAVGQTMVILTAGIDLSVGSVAGLSGVVGSMAMANWGMPMTLGIVVGILVGAVAGTGNGLLVTRAGLPPFIATLGMMGVARGLTFIVSGAVAIYGLPDAFRKVGEGEIGPVPLPLLYLVVIAIAGHLVLTRTRLGRFTAGLKKHPKLKLVETQYSENDYNQALTVTQNVLTAHPDLVGIFAANEASDVGAVEAVRLAHRAGKVKIVGWDTSPDEVEGVRTGMVSALISQNPFRMGYDGVRAAVAQIRDHKRPTSQDTGVVVVTKQNLDDPKVRQFVSPTCG